MLPATQISDNTGLSSHGLAHALSCSLILSLKNIPISWLRFNHPRKLQWLDCFENRVSGSAGASVNAPGDSKFTFKARHALWTQKNLLFPLPNVWPLFFNHILMILWFRTLIEILFADGKKVPLPENVCCSEFEATQAQKSTKNHLHSKEIEERIESF